LSNHTDGIQQVTASRNLANQDRPCDSPGLPGSSPRFTLINAAGRVTGGVFFFCTSLLFAADARVDHATVCGADLTSMQAALKSAGINTVYGGAHNNHATEMSLASFPDGSYLELIAIQKNADPKAVREHVWAKFMEENSGPCAWALQSKDLAAETARLKAAGVAVSAPSRAGRLRPDGVKLEWQTADVGESARGTLFPFLIQDLTPRAQRAFPQGKPVTREFKGVARVVIAVKNLDDAIARYRAAYGSPPPIKQVDPQWGAHLALLGNVPVILAQPLNTDSWLKQRIERFGEGPCAFVLAAARASRSKAAARSRWFGAEISWFDSERLGWRLGVE